MKYNIKLITKSMCNTATVSTQYHTKVRDFCLVKGNVGSYVIGIKDQR